MPKQDGLKSEIYLWQLHILEHPDDKECYEDAISSNLNKLKTLNIKVDR